MWKSLWQKELSLILAPMGLVPQGKKIRNNILNLLRAQNGPGAITLEDMGESCYLVIGGHNRGRVECLWINQA